MMARSSGIVKELASTAAPLRAFDAKKR